MVKGLVGTPFLYLLNEVQCEYEPQDNTKGEFGRYEFIRVRCSAKTRT